MLVGSSRWSTCLECVRLAQVANGRTAIQHWRSISSQTHHQSVQDVDTANQRPSFKRLRQQTGYTNARDVLPKSPRSASYNRTGYNPAASTTVTSTRYSNVGSQGTFISHAAGNRSAPAANTREATKDQYHPKTDDPFVLSKRVMEMYHKNGLKAALEELRQARRAAKTVAVYNIFLKEILRQGHIQAGYDLWMDMKRNGLVPTPRSYTVFFSSIKKADLKGDLPQKVEIIYKQWQAFCDRASDPNDPAYSLAQSPEYRISSIPTDAYVNLLSRKRVPIPVLVNKLLQEPLSCGGRAPTRRTYTSVFGTISARLEYGQKPSSSAEVQGYLYGCTQAWRQLVSHRKRGICTLDGHLLSVAAQAWRFVIALPGLQMTQEDKTRLLDEFEELLHLQPPEVEVPTHFVTDPETQKLVAVPRFEPDAGSLYDAMVLATALEGQHSGRLLTWWSRLVGSRGTLNGLIENRHCELYMKASPQSAVETLTMLLRSSGATRRPRASTWATAMAVSSFVDQVRILAQLTGRKDLLASSEVGLLDYSLLTETQRKNMPRSKQKGHHTKHQNPDAKMLVILLQTALDQQDWRKIARALSIVETFDPSKISVAGSEAPSTKEKEYHERLRSLQQVARTKLEESKARSKAIDRLEDRSENMPGV